MAKDVQSTSKAPSSSTSESGSSPTVSNSANNGNSAESETSPTNNDQKVPPLRIVLNTGGNQKSSSSSFTNISQSDQNQHESYKATNQTAKSSSDSNNTTSHSKGPGKVRIKLGNSNKQNNNVVDTSNSHTTNLSSSNEQLNSDDKPKSNVSQENTNTTKEDKDPVIYNHLRRITRRSHRAVQQVISNEDEESMTSMTSTDDNNASSTNNNNNINIVGNNLNQNNDNENSLDDNSNTASSSHAAASRLAGNSSSGETPRRYKRRKCEPSESQSNDLENFFNHLNYKPPNQNSFELYKNIRKQVDNKLRNLNIVQPKIPHGLKNYMLTRGAYLLAGCRLGNGTNLYMNEEGGIYSAPVAKFRYKNQASTINYSIPNRSCVPNGLSVNSPLYNLFTEQERERYKMRIQHLKEREKLTLAAEQEILRVFSKAALVAANQDEPFSACTMLKHQEIYNSFDSYNTLTTNAETTEASREDGAGSRRDASTSAAGPADVVTETTPQTNTNNSTKSDNISPENSSATNSDSGQTAIKKEIEIEQSKPEESSSKSSIEEQSGDYDKLEQEKKKIDIKETDCSKPIKSPIGNTEDSNPSDSDAMDSDNRLIIDDQKIEHEDDDEEESNKDSGPPKPSIDDSKVETDPKAADVKDDQKEEPKVVTKVSSEISESKSEEKMEIEQEPDKKTDSINSTTGEKNENSKIPELDKDGSQAGSNITDGSGSVPKNEGTGDQSSPMDIVETSQDQAEVCASMSAENEEDLAAKQARELDLFLNQLQEVDDKWERIRTEMLIRHRNEAESLHAVQTLEWEWKAKEIGACDVRLNPPIDETLVPKLNIHLQDY